MEDKENAVGTTWNEVDSTGTVLGKNIISPDVANSPTILNEITSALNASHLASVRTLASGPTEMQKQQISLQNPTKDKPLKTPNLSAPISEKRVLGSYRGRIVPSKINSFRRASENEGRKNSLPDNTKFLVRTRVLSTGAGMRDAAVTVTTAKPAAFAKAVPVTSHQIRPSMNVPVSHSKPALYHEKQSVAARTVNKKSPQKNPNKNWKPLQNTMTANGASSVPRKKRTVTQTLTRPVSKTHGTLKSANNIKSALAESVEVKRAHPPKWQVPQGIKRLPASLSDDTQCKRESPQRAIKEPVKSFWTAMAEEDEQRLFSDSVDKALAECLSLIEKGFPDDGVQTVLEKMVESVPDAKKLAKYWVCQMRLEQCRSIEKVLSIYEKAILAGAKPKDELRRALADAMKDTNNFPKSEKCVETRNTQNPDKQVNLDKESIDHFSDIPLNKKIESNSEEMPLKKLEHCLKSEQGTFPDDCKHKIKEQKPPVSKKEVHEDNANEDTVLELQTPEDDQGSSYLIKYNLSTTPYLESTKKKLQCEASDSTVKDLKFLTPVRRSRRIQGKVNKLPAMLKDHSPCVSSLEELGELGNTGMGFLYRENSALHKVLVCKQEEQKKE